MTTPALEALTRIRLLICRGNPAVFNADKIATDVALIRDALVAGQVESERLSALINKPETADFLVCGRGPHPVDDPDCLPLWDKCERIAQRADVDEAIRGLIENADLCSATCLVRLILQVGRIAP